MDFLCIKKKKKKRGGGGGTGYIGWGAGTGEDEGKARRWRDWIHLCGRGPRRGTGARASPWRRRRVHHRRVPRVDLYGNRRCPWRGSNGGGGRARAGERAATGVVRGRSVPSRRGRPLPRGRVDDGVSRDEPDVTLPGDPRGEGRSQNSQGDSHALVSPSHLDT